MCFKGFRYEEVEIWEEFVYVVFCGCEFLLLFKEQVEDYQNGTHLSIGIISISYKGEVWWWSVMRCENEEIAIFTLIWHNIITTIIVKFWWPLLWSWSMFELSSLKK